MRIKWLPEILLLLAALWLTSCNKSERKAYQSYHVYSVMLSNLRLGDGGAAQPGRMDALENREAHRLLPAVSQR